ncbi:hypothetical protein AKJ57_05355 [candidate division MSBL1 archaeon SCGC-AAA259A05]|uniref:Tyr recombinase domain-containing protein n=1 Tax=candidate division MSBL1 archaeon SCGC-AAA259A05 TaxID=1698259 RepID=A0A133U5F1_9EURY|nr:hypothetical protein AKJ57_05355 [candidate division MSBL1 archaeon SCGC-AAA259A05]
MSYPDKEEGDWHDRLGVDGWSCEKFESVGELLRYLGKEKSGSEASRMGYCQLLDQFCRQSERNPDELVDMSREGLEKLLKEFLDEFSDSPGTANTYANNLKTFFGVNGREGLEFPHYYQPSRGGRVTDEYIPTLEEARKMVECAGSLKARAVIWLLLSCGLRNSTLTAIKYGEGNPDPNLKDYMVREELAKGKENLMIAVYPEMKETVPGACKGKIPYYVFSCEEATEALRDYLEERKRKHGEIPDDAPLFPSGHTNLPEPERQLKPISSREVRNIVKKAARRADLERWENVHPHSLRKTFKKVIQDQPPKSKLDKDDQEFFMGHIIPGTREAYYDSTKVGDMREKFSKLSFEPEPPQDEQFLRRMAKFHGVDYEAVAEEARGRNGGELDTDVATEVLREHIAEREEQKIVEKEELQSYLDDGWKVEQLSGDDALISKRALPDAEGDGSGDGEDISKRALPDAEGDGSGDGEDISKTPARDDAGPRGDPKGEVKSEKEGSNVVEPDSGSGGREEEKPEERDRDEVRRKSYEQTGLQDF